MVAGELVPMQALLLEMDSGGGLLLALNASAIYFGSAVAGVVGGVVIGLGGLLMLPMVAAALVVVVIGLAMTLRRGRRRPRRWRWRRRSTPGRPSPSSATQPAASICSEIDAASAASLSVIPPAQ
jgi:MFS family permease